MNSYNEFLEVIENSFIISRLKDFDKARDKTCLLRHDVDVDFKGALKMAQIEDELGLHSTYFMFHTGVYTGFPPYYKSEVFVEKCRNLQDMGHEIGFHNNVIEACPENPVLVFLRELNFLRSKGIKIHGVSNHGRIENYLIFKECSSVRGERGSQPTLSLKDLALYEACFLPIKQDGYLTDSRGTWRYLTGEEQNECHPNFTREKNDIEDINEFITNLSKRKDVKIVQLVTHPSWWSLK